MSAEWDDVVEWLDLFLGDRFRTEDLLKGLTEQGWQLGNGCGHEALVEKIIDWSKAYPLSVFPEPPPGEHGSVDTCSARMGRHVIGRLMELTPEAAHNHTNRKDEAP